MAAPLANPTYDISVLTDLRERVRRAERHDRELNARIYAALLHPSPFERMAEPDFHSRDPDNFCWYDADGSRITCWRQDSFTSDIEAAIRLVERLLPKCFWGIENGFAEYRSYVTAPEWSRCQGRGKDMVLSLLDALLSVLIARAQSEAPQDARVET